MHLMLSHGRLCLDLLSLPSKSINCLSDIHSFDRAALRKAAMSLPGGAKTLYELLCFSSSLRHEILLTKTGAQLCSILCKLNRFCSLQNLMVNSAQNVKEQPSHIVRV